MARSLLKSGAFSSLYVMYGAAAAFAATLIVSNGVGEKGAGTFFQIMALFAIGTSLSVFGADTGLVRTMSAQKAVGRNSVLPRLLRFAVVPASVLSVLLIAAVLIVAGTASGLSAEVRTTLYAAAPFLLVSTWMTLAFGALRGLGHTVEFTFLQSALLPTARIVAVLVAVAYSGAVLYLALAWSLPLVLVFLVALLWVRKYLPEPVDVPSYPAKHLDPAPAPAVAAPETARSFWSFSSARGVSAMVEAVLEWIDVLLIGLFLGPAASGVYGAVNRYVRVGVMVEHTARIVTGPDISAAIATGDTARARTIFVGATRLLIGIGWPFFITLAIFGPTLLSFFGPAFTAGAPLFWIICTAMLVQMAAGGVQSVLLMSGRARWQLYNKLSALAVAVVLNLTLIPLWGLAGAATAWAAAVLSDCLLASYQVYTKLSIRPQVAELAPVLALAAALPALTGALALTLLGQNLAGLALYAALILPLYTILLYIYRTPTGFAPIFTAITRLARR